MQTTNGYALGAGQDMRNASQQQSNSSVLRVPILDQLATDLQEANCSLAKARARLFVAVERLGGPIPTEGRTVGEKCDAPGNKLGAMAGLIRDSHHIADGLNAALDRLEEQV